MQRNHLLHDLVRKQTHQGNSMLKDIPRTADADVDAANIFDPLSNSSEPLFHAMIPCCIHFGKILICSL